MTMSRWRTTAAFSGGWRASGQESCSCLGMQEWSRVLRRCLRQDNMIILAAPALEKSQQGMVGHWFEIKKKNKKVDARSAIKMDHF